jgi:hypothetical protein
MAEPKPPSHVLLTLSGQETNMKFALIEAAVAAAAFSTLGLAQTDIEGPGYCAEFHLNEKCQNLGSGDPYTDGVYYHNDPAQTNEPNAYRYYRGPKSND